MSLGRVSFVFSGQGIWLGSRPQMTTTTTIAAVKNSVLEASVVYLPIPGTGARMSGPTEATRNACVCVI